MFTEGDSQAAIPPVQHLTSHEGVEDRGAHQGHAEIEAEEPPVLCILVELQMKKRERGGEGFTTPTSCAVPLGAAASSCSLSACGNE